MVHNPAIVNNSTISLFGQQQDVSVAVIGTGTWLLLGQDRLHFMSSVGAGQTVAVHGFQSTLVVDHADQFHGKLDIGDTRGNRWTAGEIDLKGYSVRSADFQRIDADDGILHLHGRHGGEITEAIHGIGTFAVYSVPGGSVIKPLLTDPAPFGGTLILAHQAV